MSVPGASRTLIEARVPYARESMLDLFGGREPKQYVSVQTARDLAATAYRRGVRLSPAGQSARHVVGVGCTCALTSVPVKKGEHRCVVATYGVAGVTEYALTMEKGRRDRWEEDGLASRLIVQALVDAAAEASAAEAATGGADDRRQRQRMVGQEEEDDEEEGAKKNKNKKVDVLATAVHPPGDVLTVTRTPVRDALDWLTSGGGDLVELTDGVPTALGVLPSLTPALVLPGSFNPLHEGHRGLLAAGKDGGITAINHSLTFFFNYSYFILNPTAAVPFPSERCLLFFSFFLTHKNVSLTHHLERPILKPPRAYTALIVDFLFLS